MGYIDLFEKVTEKFNFPDLYGQEHIFWFGRESLIFLSLDKPPQKQLLERDLSELKDSLDEIGKADTELFLCIWKENDEFRSVFKSRSSRVRAMDFLNYVLSDVGLVKGDSVSSYGRITTASLLVRLGELGLNDVSNYFMHMTLQYFEDCDLIIADEYSRINQNEILNMKQYRKKHVPWAFVRSADIAKSGTRIDIRTLENESGIDFTAGDDTYVMIGIQGEVYYISAAKFKKTYNETDEPFDIFTRMTMFIPEIKILPDGKYISIDEMARICYPKNTSKIYAQRLDRRAKVFPVYDRENYFLGFAGDYMAIRCDDLSDIYIIKRQIFLQTYEEV